VAGSIGRSETTALLGLLAEAALGFDAVEVWVKGHPVQPVEPLLDRVGLTMCAGWRICSEPVAHLLRQVRVVIVGSTTVGIEALAAGCAVIKPTFPDVLSASPLDGFEQCYARVVTPSELVDAVSHGLDEGAPAEARELALRYWTLDGSLPRWRALLSHSAA
jgi:surface carbohydrate biosynthesis protein (TIGR04326 family)